MSGNNIETIDLNDFLSDGIIKEKDFKKKVDIINWNTYSDKKVLIKGCASVPIPTWAYMMITSQLLFISLPLLPLLFLSFPLGLGLLGLVLICCLPRLSNSYSINLAILSNFIPFTPLNEL